MEELAAIQRELADKKDFMAMIPARNSAGRAN